MDAANGEALGWLPNLKSKAPIRSTLWLLMPSNDSKQTRLRYLPRKKNSLRPDADPSPSPMNKIASWSCFAWRSKLSRNSLTSSKVNCSKQVPWEHLHLLFKRFINLSWKGIHKKRKKATSSNKTTEVIVHNLHKYILKKSPSHTYQNYQNLGC